MGRGEGKEVEWKEYIGSEGAEGEKEGEEEEAGK